MDPVPRSTSSTTLQYVPLPTAKGVPKQSPIQVMSRPNVTLLDCLIGNWCKKGLSKDTATFWIHSAYSTALCFESVLELSPRQVTNPYLQKFPRRLFLHELFCQIFFDFWRKKPKDDPQQVSETKVFSFPSKKLFCRLSLKLKNFQVLSV